MSGNERVQPLVQRRVLLNGLKEATKDSDICRRHELVEVCRLHERIDISEDIGTERQLLVDEPAQLLVSRLVERVRHKTASSASARAPRGVTSGRGGARAGRSCWNNSRNAHTM